MQNLFDLNEHKGEGSFGRLYFADQLDDVLIEDVDFWLLMFAAGHLPLHVFVGGPEMCGELVEGIDVEFFYFVDGFFEDDVVDVDYVFLLVLLHANYIISP